MNFSESSGTQQLPQFSEITSRSNSVSSSSYTATSGQLFPGQNSVYTTAAAACDSGKQSIMVNTANKYPGTLLAWPNPNALMQLCEKQGLQTINIPNYSQNSPLLSVPSNSLPVRLLPNMYLPTTSQINTQSIKQEEVSNNISSNSGNNNLDSHAHLQQQSAAMAEYLQKLQATTLPLTLQQLIKLQTDPIKKEKSEEDQKTDQHQNNILNIPSVPGFRNNLQNGNSFLSSDSLLSDISPSDLNIHIESDSINDSTIKIEPPVKVEQQIQTDSPKTERKVKFRAKTGEIKIAMALDGSMLYCCPECNHAFAEKTDIERHIQGHVQERKYQCKECGAMLKRKEHLDQHMRGHSDERPFKCPVCQKAFKRNEHLTRHYVIHSGDKNFLCNICQKAFSRKDHLNKHTQTHLGIRRGKVKKDTLLTEMKNNIESIGDSSKQELNYLLKDGTFIKQDSTFLQHIQNLQKDQNFCQTFSVFKEQALKESSMHQQQAVNMNEILPQNTRYMMPS
ncbi:zinc finger protein 875-like [Chelonus insularis]|uniref:zinc finger protein 875-like n=1 Tax=Chelonus insularis TaxID=460826 RepID=UPI001588839F|nr:zinc finger protein 875-like [Chelonus insularis]